MIYCENVVKILWTLHLKKKSNKPSVGGGINGLIYATKKWMPRQIGIEKPIHSITHNYISIKLKILKHVYTIQTWRTAPPTPKPITSPPLLWASDLHRATGTAAPDLRFVLLWFSLVWNEFSFVKLTSNVYSQHYTTSTPKSRTKYQ